MGLSVTDDDDDDSPIPSPLPHMPSTPGGASQSFVASEGNKHSVVLNGVKIQGTNESSPRPAKRLFDMESILAPDSPKAPPSEHLAHAEHAPIGKHFDGFLQRTGVRIDSRADTEESAEKETQSTDHASDVDTNDMESKTEDKSDEIKHSNASVSPRTVNSDDDCVVDVESDDEPNTDKTENLTSDDLKQEHMHPGRQCLPGLVYCRSEQLNSSNTSGSQQYNDQFQISKYVSKGLLGVQSLQMPIILDAFKNHYLPVTCVTTKPYSFPSISNGVGMEALYRWRQTLTANMLANTLDRENTGKETQ